MEQNEQAAREAEHHPDPIDRASAETAIHVQDAIDAQRLRNQQARARWAPREDGCCACGCGEEVDPRRLALGYGLTIECAQKMERR